MNVYINPLGPEFVPESEVFEKKIPTPEGKVRDMLSLTFVPVVMGLIIGIVGYNLLFSNGRN